MNLMRYLSEELCLPGMPARDRTDCLARLCDHLHQVGRIQDPGDLTEALLARERIESTAIGGGIALPHVRSGQVARAFVAIAHLDDPIDFRAHDDAPVDLVFLLVGSRDHPGQHLRVLAGVSQLLRDRAFLTATREAQSAAEIYEAVRSTEAAAG